MTLQWISRGALGAVGLAATLFAAEASAQWCGNSRSCCPSCTPCQPYTAGQPTPAGPMMDGMTNPEAPDMMNTPAVDNSPLMGDQFAYGGGIGGGAAGNANVGGYIDNAVLANRARIRYDNVQGGNNDFAEFLYGGYLVNGNPAIQNYDYNEVSVYLEYLLTERLSIFVDTPFRAAVYDDFTGFLGGIGPGVRRDEAGIADMNAGLRYAVVDNGCDFLTAQLKVFIPTGNPEEGLGTGHASLQPGLLAQRNYDRLTMFGELHDWISLGNAVVDAFDPNFAGRQYGGNVLRYGLGAAYDVARSDCRKVQLVGEFVGWTCLYGFRSTGPLGPLNPAGGATNVVDASGDTIVNFKAGVRYVQGNHTVYVGYGFPLTADPNQLYNSIIRVDYTYLGW